MYPNVFDRALKEFNEQYGSDDTLSHYILILQSGAEFKFIFTSRHMLNEINELIRQDYPAFTIRYAGFVSTLFDNAKVGYLFDWNTFQSSAIRKSIKNFEHRLVF